MARMFVCTETFFAQGFPAPIEAGRTIVDENSDLYKRFSHYFKEVEAHYGPDAESPVEAATAAPGEKRTR